MLLEQEVPHLLVQPRHQLLLTVSSELISAQPPALPQIYPILPGSSPSKGLKIETQLPLGSRVQLSLQEPRASSRRLKELLDRQDAPSGILQFNSLDRGASFYGRPHHDASLVYASLGARPHLGVGCRMELLSLGGRTRLVRGSSTLGLLQPRRWN